MSTRTIQFATPAETDPHRGNLQREIEVRMKRHQALADAFVWFFRTVGALPRALVRWHQYRSVRTELAHMDPRLLKDIGIEPGRVDAIAAQIAANENGWRGAA